MQRLIMPAAFAITLFGVVYLSWRSSTIEWPQTADVIYSGLLDLNGGDLLIASELARSGDPEDLRRAKEKVEEILANDPLDSEATELLAIIANQMGEREKAGRLFDVSVSLSRYNSSAQMAVGMAALLRGDHARAVEMIDVLSRNGSQADAHALVALGLNLSDFRTIFGEKLATAPSWREAFFVNFVGRTAKRDALFALADLIQERGIDLSPIERNAILSRAVNLGEIDWAHEIWAKAQASPDMPGTFPHNGAFARAPDGSPFDWIFSTSNRVRTSLAPDRGLSISLAPGRHNYPLARQLVVLQSGQWQARARVEVEGISARLGFGMRATCATGDRARLFETQGVTNAGEIHELLATFDIAETGCGAMWLELAILGRAPTDYDTQGRIDVRSVTITPVRIASQPPAAPPPAP